MELIHALILGIVEGLTEFLPVSSTGHLILTGKLLGLAETDFLKTFDVAIQLGAILAVVVLYGRSLLVDPRILLRIAAAFVPTAAVGLLAYPLVKSVFMESERLVLTSLFVGGLAIIAFERFFGEREGAAEDLRKLPFKTAVLIGLFQSIALIPGVSRSAATILGGLFLGLRRKTIVEFSFLLAVPTMLAATGLDLVKNAPSFTAGELKLLGVGLATSFLVAVASIRFFLRFIQTNRFTAFGVYRVLVAVIFFFAF